MKCPKCGANAEKSTTSETIEMGFGLLIIRNVPCYKCTECDEVLYPADVLRKIEEITGSFRDYMQEIAVIDYTKVA